MSYTEFKNSSSSEKITLAILEASKRLMGWTLHSGSVYRISENAAVISSVRERNINYTEVHSIAEVIASTFFYDRDNQLLYVRTSDSLHPNSKFITIRTKLFFADASVTLPHDLEDGFEVYFEPSIQSTSQFGVEIDTINQMGEAIEGKGTLNLYNDFNFWPNKFDKLTFENQNCVIYSWNRGLLPIEAKKLFEGKVESKTWSEKNITFRLKDLLSNLRDFIPLSNISELNARTEAGLENAKQRMIFGRLFGYKPVNTDEVLDGYPLTGTVSVNTDSNTVTGTGTVFLTELSPDDRVNLNEVEYTVATVTSNTSFTITSVYSAVNLAGASITVVPDQPKRFINRTWKLAGHALRQPETVVAGGTTVNRLLLQSTRDIFAGDSLYIGELGSGELVTVKEILNSTTCTLLTSLPAIPSIGTPVLRPCVQDVRLNDLRLEFYRDFEVDAENGTLTLRATAEANSSPIREMVQTVTFAASSRSVTGSGFETTLRPGDMLRVKGNSAFHEILSIESDTALTLRTAPDYSGTSNGQYRSYIFSSGDTLSCEILGRTDDDTTSGNLLRKAPDIVEQLLLDAGLSGSIDSNSFTAALDVVPFDVAFAVPDLQEDVQTPTYRDIINRINRSVFGSLIQNGNFKLAYSVIQPKKPIDAIRLRESDILSLNVSTTNENMVKQVVVAYNRREYDYNQKTEAVSYTTRSSNTAEFLLETNREKTFSVYLTNQSDATIYANRWAFLLENATSKLTIQTKLQAIDLDVNDVIDIEDRRLYERFSGTSRRKIVAIESITKSGKDVTIKAVDLSNAFNRVAMITDSNADYENSNEETQLYGGYITDEYGMIDNDPVTFGSNLIW